MSKPSKISTKAPVNSRNQISSYFTQNKNNNDESAQTQSEKKEPDIFAEALKKQSECLNQPTDPISPKPSGTNVPSYEQLNDLVIKLEAMLNDEKKAKRKLFDDYKRLERKYVSNLQSMVKTQSLLLNHKIYMQNMTPAERNEAIELNDDSRNQQELDEVEQVLLVDVEQDFQDGNIQVEVINYISDEDIAKLKLIQPDKTHDSTFIKDLVNMLYVDKEMLKCRTVTGRSRIEGAIKQPITPEKMELITELFMKRIEKCGASNEEKVMRLTRANINRLIGHSIYNLNTKSTKSQHCD